jgi:polyisoprenyl-phosphate glycosyltransferase
MKLSIVVPVYKEEKTIPHFLSKVVPILESITSNYEILFSMDPSPDRTEAIILLERERNPRVKLISLSRRFGQPMATLAGLSHASGDAVIVMDVDLQDPPSLIPEMVGKWQSGFDVVYAQRISRTGEPWLKKIIAHLGYRFINKVADVNIPPNTGDFRLLSKRALKQILSLKECHGFLRGMVAIVGFPSTSVPFERPARVAGESNYNRFFGSIRIGMNGVVCFSNYLLTLSSLLGFLTAGAAFLFGLLYLVMKLAGAPFPMGNPTIVILVLFLGGVQLISIGILGEYIGRIYDEVKQRPKFIVERSHGIED